MAMTTCPNCGEPISEKAKKCVHCGTVLIEEEKKICPDCGAELEDGADTCPKCGCPIEPETAGEISPQQVEVTGVKITQKSKKMIIIAIIAIIAVAIIAVHGSSISGQISTTTKEYLINYQDMQGIGMTSNLALPTLIALCSAALSKPTLSSLAVLGEISIGGTLIKVDELASTLQVCLDSGAKKVLLPMTSAADLGSVPSDLVGAFSLIFYSSAEEAVYKALGVE